MIPNRYPLETLNTGRHRLVIQHRRHNQRWIQNASIESENLELRQLFDKTAPENLLGRLLGTGSTYVKNYYRNWNWFWRGASGFNGYV